MDTNDLNRRGFLAAGGVGVALLFAAGKADAADMSATEKANLKVVSDFCAAWATLDPEKLGSFLADDVTFRMIDDAPRIDGKATLVTGMQQYLADVKSANFDVKRSHAIGNLVINERIDHFDRGEKKDAFPVAGFFLVKDGKIVEWQDYQLPKA